MTLHCLEYRAPFVPAILPGSTHMCCIAMELGIATPITFHHTASYIIFSGLATCIMFKDFPRQNGTLFVSKIQECNF